MDASPTERSESIATSKSGPESSGGEPLTRRDTNEGSFFSQRPENTTTWGLELRDPLHNMAFLLKINMCLPVCLILGLDGHMIQLVQSQCNPGVFDYKSMLQRVKTKASSRL